MILKIFSIVYVRLKIINIYNVVIVFALSCEYPEG